MLSIYSEGKSKYMKKESYNRLFLIFIRFLQHEKKHRDFVQSKIQKGFTFAKISKLCCNFLIFNKWISNGMHKNFALKKNRFHFLCNQKCTISQANIILFETFTLYQNVSYKMAGASRIELLWPTSEIGSLPLT